ncbi:GDSL-type esterase/lipase family protein [Dyadobacter sp. NIV53]|uniref:GDSL-type esterase/lipase family protein n=1 Tax=Dyadobacter sp. NIV53 TaxID=2861765 RepID=UPI001C872D82|nr:GDSL-type esterase/lipase family protein [Dyadobacter sp. NIV53]
MIWYEDEVKRVEKECASLSYKPEAIFYGSSSITLWKTLYTDFEEFKPVNLGFGGSTLAACGWFFERVLAPVTSAKCIIIYAGDNDIGDGRNPQEVSLFYRELLHQIRGRFGDIPCFYISIKPSLKRWELIKNIRETNELIQLEVRKDPNQKFIDLFPDMLNNQDHPRASLFEQDGLHLSAKGYELWKKNY